VAFLKPPGKCHIFLRGVRKAMLKSYKIGLGTAITDYSKRETCENSKALCNS
jgi:hypothetical protein